MIVLALDTTGRAGSVAVVEDGRVRAELTGNPDRTHGERLPGDLLHVLDAAGVPLSAVDLLAVAAGPGSFTGLRVGIAAIQGLSTATGRLIVPVSALDALSAAAGGDGLVGAWIDAQRGQVYAALYDLAAGEIGEAIEPATSLPPRATLDLWAAHLARPARFIGDGAVRHAEVIASALPGAAAIVPAPALAGIIGRLAASRPERAVRPHAVVPIYVRRPDAELARLRQADRPEGRD